MPKIRLIDLAKEFCEYSVEECNFRVTGYATEDDIVLITDTSEQAFIAVNLFIDFVARCLPGVNELIKNPSSIPNWDNSCWYSSVYIGRGSWRLSPTTEFIC